MSKFARKNSIQVTRFALVAFKDTLSTSVCSTDDLAGPKIKCVGATVKVTSNSLVQKGTIVTISDNRESLVKQCEYFNVRKYFGISSRTKSVQGTHVVKKETPLNKRSVSVAGQIPSRNVSKVNSTPISTRRSVCYNRPLPSPIVNPKDPYKFPDTPSPIRSMKKRPSARPKSSTKQTTIGSSPRLRQSLITDFFPFINRTSSSYSDETLNIEYEMNALDETNLSDVFEEDHIDTSIIFVNKLDNLFDMIPESLLAKHLREEFYDEVNTSNSSTSSYITNNYGICFARDVILNNASHNSNVMTFLDLQQSARIPTIDPLDIHADSETSAGSTTTLSAIHAPELIVSQADISALQTSVKSNEKPPTSMSPSKSSRLPTTNENIYEGLTPMEFFRSLMLKCNYSKLDANLITEDVLQAIKLRSKTPEIFARNLMYRLFTIQELKGCNVYGKGYTNGIRNGHLNPDVVKTINQLTYRMFPFIRFSWQSCILWMNKSIKYVTSLIPEKSTITDPEPDVTPILSSTIIQHSDSYIPHSTVDVSIIELGSTALTHSLDSSLITYQSIPKASKIRRDSSVYIPMLKTTTPESWDDSLLQLSTTNKYSFRTIQPALESWENSLLQLSIKNKTPESWEHSLLNSVKPILESWEDSLLQLSINTLKSTGHSLPTTIQPTLESWEDSMLQLSINTLTSPEHSLLTTIQPTPESWEDSLLQLSIMNMTSPEARKHSLLKTIQPTSESWKDSLLQLSIQNMTSTESWEQPLRQLDNMKSPAPESWEESLLSRRQEIWENSFIPLVMSLPTPESWNDSLMQMSINSSPTPESWEQSLLQLDNMKSLAPESWEESLLQLSRSQEFWESSLILLANSLSTLESWDDSLLQMSINSTSTPESWEQSLLQLDNMKSPAPESWEESFLQLSRSQEIWENSFIPLVMSLPTPESWNDSLMQMSINSSPTPESWEQSLLQLDNMKSLAPESWEESLLQLSRSQEFWESSLILLANSLSTLESWDDSLLQMSINSSPTTESWEQSLLQLDNMKSPAPVSWEESFLQLSRSQEIPDCWDDSLLQMSIISTPSSESWEESLIRLVSSLESWEDSLLYLTFIIRSSG